MLMNINSNMMEDDDDDRMEDEEESFSYSNYQTDDTMDTSVDVEEQIKFGSEKINEYNKRVRIGEFNMDTLIEGEDVERMAPFKENPKFPIHRIKPFSSDLSQLPGYKKPSDHFNPFIGNHKRPFITDEETQMKYKQWKYEQDKEEIRQIIKLNRYNKLKAMEQERRINQIGQREFTSNLFIIGKEPKRYHR